MVILEILSSVKGHNEIFIEDDNPKQRADLSDQVYKLLEKKYTVFLVQGDEVRRIKGYDSETNEWLVAATPDERASKRIGRIKARRSRVTAVAATSGG